MPRFFLLWGVYINRFLCFPGKSVFVFGASFSAHSHPIRKRVSATKDVVILRLVLIECSSTTIF